jgi:hypothetical protein
MAKKRTSLDSLFAPAEEEVKTLKLKEQPKTISKAIKKPETKSTANKPNGRLSADKAKSKSEIVKQTVYLPPAVYEQLRQLAFEERKKMHDYLVEGLDRVFKDRGLKPYLELSDETK